MTKTLLPYICILVFLVHTWQGISLVKMPKWWGRPDGWWGAYKNKRGHGKHMHAQEWQPRENDTRELSPSSGAEQSLWSESTKATVTAASIHSFLFFFLSRNRLPQDSPAGSWWPGDPVHPLAQQLGQSLQQKGLHLARFWLAAVFGDSPQLGWVQAV